MQFGLTLDHEYFRPVIHRTLDLGYDFMVHVGDPDEWFLPGGGTVIRALGRRRTSTRNWSGSWAVARVS